MAKPVEVPCPISDWEQIKVTVLSLPIRRKKLGVQVRGSSGATSQAKGMKVLSRRPPPLTALTLKKILRSILFFLTPG